MANTAFKNLAQPAYNSLNWHTPLNQNFLQLDQALAGTQLLNLTGFAGGDILLTNNTTFPNTGGLTDASYIPARIGVTGTMTANANIVIPTGVAGIWVVSNYTTGSFTLSFKGQGGGAVVAIAQGTNVLVYCAGADALLVGSSAQTWQLPQIGDIKQSASEWTQTGWIICDGRAVSRTTYAALFSRIGGRYGAGDGSTTFNVPDCRGRVGAGATDMGGTDSGRLNGFGIGAAGGDQYGYLNNANQLAPHVHYDNGHGHEGSWQDVHAHNYVRVDSGNGIGFGSGLGLYTVATDNAQPALHIAAGAASITSTGSGWGHPNIQPTIAFYTFIYAGV